MAKTISDLFTSDEFKNSVTDVATKYALPALLLSAGTGLVGANLAAKNKISHEDKKSRRNRILRSALFPALTTLAAAGAFGGAKVLSDLDAQEIIDKPNEFWDIHPIDFLAKNTATPLGMAAGASLAGGRIAFPTGAKGAKDPEGLLTFAVGEPNYEVSLGKDFVKNTEKALAGKKKPSNKLLSILKSKGLKKLPRITFKSGPLAAPALLSAGTIGGVMADDLIEDLLY
jgi:hypothetical protein